MTDPVHDPSPDAGPGLGGHPLAARAATLGVVLGLAALFILRGRVDFVVDDAFITFRYARNWVEWGTPAFNSFELAEGAWPVEGYSNWLWMALLALFGRFTGFDSIEGVADGLQSASAAFTVLLAASIATRRARLGPVGSFAAPLLVGTAAPFVAWSTGGMETALFALLATGLFGAVLSERARASAALFAAGVVLVRAEGIAWALGIAAAALVANGARGVRPAAAAGAGALVALAGLLAWRVATYGAWLPNTVAAKAGVDAALTTSRGFSYVGSWAIVTVTPIAVVLAAAPALFDGRPSARGAARAALFVLVGAVLYNVAVGGDWMPFFRFLAPFAPMAALVIAVALDRFRGRAVVLGALGAVGLAALQPLALLDRHVAPLAWREALQFRTFRGGYATELERARKADRNRAYFETLGAALAEATAPGDVLAFGAIGWTGWEAKDLDFLDRNGLVTPEVARREDAFDVEAGATAGHEKRVPHAWFLERGTPRPRYVYATFLPDLVDVRDPEVERRVWAGLRAPGSPIGTPEEAPLFERTSLRLVPITAGMAAGTTLVLLER